MIVSGEGTDGVLLFEKDRPQPWGVKRFMRPVLWYSARESAELVIRNWVKFMAKSIDKFGTAE